MEDIKRMNAAMYRYDGLGGGDVRHPADVYVGALVFTDKKQRGCTQARRCASGVSHHGGR